MQYTTEDRKKQVLKIIARFIRTNGYSPTLQELASELKVTKSRVALVIDLLVAEGKISKEDNKSRTLKLIYAKSR